ncbi:MAG: pseudaminic acid synthase [Flavobacteriales bacterium]|jgi:pseudaminic acid synthase|nr:pseudaminic acid synthase [Flavobacteriales bacterium]
MNFHTAKTYIIAELSANHGGDISIVKKTIQAAKDIGADAIKLQTYKADTMTLDSKKEDFMIKGTIWEGRNLHDLYDEAHLPWEWHKEIFEYSKEIGIDCFSSPFDKTAVDLLETLNCPIYKIASFEITDIPLIKYIASKGKPIIMSTGIAEYEDIKLAIETCRNTGNEDITILKCTSSYPAPIEEANMLLMQQFKKDFGVKIGLSDHTMGTTLPVVATALGASVIEKHFILDKSIGGPDASFSLDVKEFEEMIQAVRLAESALGNATYTLTEKQQAGRQYARSLYIAKDIAEGEIFTEENLRSVRPGLGAHPKHLEATLGTPATKNWEKGDRFIID